MAGLTPMHLLLILGIALLVIGPGKLPEVGSALGKSIREFRDAASGTTGTADTTGVAGAVAVTPASMAPVAAAPVAPVSLAADAASPETAGGVGAPHA